MKNTKEERYWEVWTAEHVDRLEKEVWGEAGKHPRGRHHELIQRHTKLIPKDTKTILEVGCGMGHLYSEIKESGYDYRGRDTSIAMVNKFKERFPEADVGIGDVFNLQDQEKADCVICEDVLMHLPEIETPTRELWSRVVDGGTLIVSHRMSGEDKPSWLIEREYIPMPNEVGSLLGDKRLIIRGTNPKEFGELLDSLTPKPETWTQHFYDERTSIFEVKHR